MASRGELHGLRLLERIGEGGIADVFRTTWEGKAVALKVLRDPDRPAMRKRFLREGRLLQRLSHPGLVRCFHVFGGSQPALVLELLRGEPLDDRIARRPMNGEEAVHLAQALLRVLQYLHEHGIVHRDVKASNVYCADDNRVVLMDLGLAVDPADPLTTTLGDVLGTYAYMAPEQIAGAESDHRTDLYSLGITLYEAVCGARPFSARGAAGWLSVHRSGGATPLIEVAPGIPVRLASLVDRLMSRDPAGRPPSAAVALALLTGSVGIRRDLRRPSL
ncbi:MAG: serine/threonine protein kinase, partial [Deltaproteobacteria bacterium]|nr:serine/threonine protein kinase [Deltaproteobacteria bacterium]